jgi:hypothetical protein
MQGCYLECDVPALFPPNYGDSTDQMFSRRMQTALDRLSMGTSLSSGARLRSLLRQVCTIIHMQRFSKSFLFAALRSAHTRRRGQQHAGSGGIHFIACRCSERRSLLALVFEQNKCAGSVAFLSVITDPLLNHITQDKCSCPAHLLRVAH